MRNALILILALLSTCSLFVSQEETVPITLEDIKFCYERELWDILEDQEGEVYDLLAANPGENLLYDVLERIAFTKQDTLQYIELVDKRINNLGNLNDVFKQFRVLKDYSSQMLQKKLDNYHRLFPDESEQIMMRWQAGNLSEEEMLEAISKLDTYPAAFENIIRRYVDEAAVERDDSLRIAQCRKFADNYPQSLWQDLSRYLMTVSLLNLGEYEQVVSEIKSYDGLSPALSYLYSSLLQRSDLRKNYKEGAANNKLLEHSLLLLRGSSFPEDQETIKVIYNEWDEEYWDNQVSLLQAKAIYYTLINESKDYWGDESLIVNLEIYSHELFDEGYNVLSDIDFRNNDFGEIAEWKYWLGRYAVLDQSKIENRSAAEHLIDCLIAGAPRKRFDDSAFAYLSHIHDYLQIEKEIMDWCRYLKNYTGPVFDDVTEKAGLGEIRSSRVAVADYDNDGYTDILFNGRLLFRNNGDFSFSNVTEEAGIVNYGFRGGLWADYNKDGNIDFAAFARSDDPDDERGNKLYLNNGDGTFSLDQENDIDDLSPTEGAAFVDIDNNGYPSLYLANYEDWGVRTGYEDFFWYNDKGSFINKSEDFGLHKPQYTTEPGLAGRGVSPADYNNDGRQSIFVSNYRLHRNFLWDKQDGEFVDNAALHNVHGHLQRGHYGHTIGADWGDYNNNGYLDLFLCNLAHPRFLEFSDISMLLRNDGSHQRKIGERTVSYHKFTDVTKEAGIAFDELHSDPNWFDAVNNGRLDLYMTSVYENDRSYLYLNNGDGTFTDITFLSGIRVYNGWGNATADFNNNGRMDLVVGSGSGVRLFKNITQNEYSSVSFKPYWDDDQTKIVSKDEWDESIPNSPAFGTRVEVVVKDDDGSERRLIRELNGGKGTTSQNDQYLHFGLGKGTLRDASIRRP